MGQSLGSISSAPSIIKYGDGYWASIVFDDGFTIISSDIPPVRCPGRDKCSFEVIELDSGVAARISSILGVGVERILMICANLIDVCSGVTIKIFARGEPGEVSRAFSSGRGEVFRLMAEIYGSL